MDAAGSEEAGAALCAMARALYLRGWMDGTAGNLSVRLGGSALITASGRSKGELTPADTVPVEAATGRRLSPAGPAPSAETAVHAALYRVLPDCGAVVHAHCPHAAALSALVVEAGFRSAHFTGFEILKGLSPADAVTVPVFRNWPDVRRIADEVAAHFSMPCPGQPPVLLIGHHGATAWGPTLAAARDRLECLEALCQLYLLADRSPFRTAAEAIVP